MAVLNAEVLDAFLAAGVPEDKARKAAESLAAHDTRYNKLEQEQVVGFAKMERQITEVKAELTVIKWMGGIIVAGVVAILTRLLFVGVV